MSQRSRIIQAEAIEVAGQDYRSAVAAELAGRPSDEHWRRVARVLARAHVLIGLEGIADGSNEASRLGASLPEPGPPPSEAPLTFAEPGLSASFEAGPFVEAVRDFEGRVPRLAEEVAALTRQGLSVSEAVVVAERAGAALGALSKAGAVQAATGGSFFVTGVDGASLIDLRRLLAEVIRGDVTADAAGKMVGVGLSEFAQRARMQAGVNLTNGRLQTIFRNNLSQSYNSARAAVLTKPEVRRAIPLMMLMEIRDRRTRGNPTGIYRDRGFHWQMHKYVGTVEDFDRLGLRPPNGHNCRGSLRGVSVHEAKRSGWVTGEGELDRGALDAYNGARLAIISRGDYPDPGFLSVAGAA